MTPSPQSNTGIVPIPPATTLSYEQSASLMQDPGFHGRVKVACLRFADSILNEPSTVPAHNSRLKWAQQALQAPDLMATQIQGPVVIDGAVQSAGSAITDAALQGAVEATVIKMAG